MSDQILLLPFWKPIPGWGEYECSNIGEIRRVKKTCGAVKGKVLRPAMLKNGYLKISLCKNSKRTEYLVHRIVVMTFEGGLDSRLDVCHFDGYKTNNRLSNLRSDTRKGNMADQIRMNKTPRGEKCGSHKYPRDVILEARNLMDSGVRPAEVSRRFSMPASYVYSIKNRIVWGWL